MDLESLKPLLSILLWGALFFFMMRLGCGAHMTGGHGHGHGHHGRARVPDDNRSDTDLTKTDPVCGMQVTVASAKAATVRDGRTFYFCSTQCRDEFEAAPEKHAGPATAEEHRHG